jgi:hypothetical protein
MVLRFLKRFAQNPRPATSSRGPELIDLLSESESEPEVDLEPEVNLESEVIDLVSHLDGRCVPLPVSRMVKLGLAVLKMFCAESKACHLLTRARTDRPCVGIRIRARSRP